MAGLLDEEELLPVFSNPNIARQGARARALAAQRNVNTLPDPRTYAAVQGLLGTRPDEMGFSVLNPAYEDIRRVADPAFAVGTALGVAPLMGMARFSRPIQQASAASQRGAVRVPENKILNIDKGIFAPELTMAEMLRVKDIPTVQRVQRSMDLVGEKKFKGMVEDIFKKYKPTDQDQEAMLVEAVTLDILGRANRNPDLLRGLPGLKTPAPQEEALRLAQQRAALPVSEGGLGLPPNNTPMDRARAMGFKESGYTGTNRDFQSYDVSKAAGSGSGSREGPLGAWLTDDPRVAQSFAEWSSRGQGGDVIYPLMIRGNRPYEPSSYLEIKEILDANTKFVRPPYRMMQDKIDYEAAKEALESKGDYVALRNTMTDAIDRPITQYLIPDTSRIRSRFAAFDPFRLTPAIAATMGVAAPDLLARTVDDEERRRQLLSGLLAP